MPCDLCHSCRRCGQQATNGPCPAPWVTQTAGQKDCTILQGDEESGMTAQTGVSALHPLFALSTSLYFFILPACNFLGWKATGPKAAQKLWLFLSVFGTRCPFWLVFHISQIWSHQHQEDTSENRSTQYSLMAEPNNETHMYSCREGSPSLP